MQQANPHTQPPSKKEQKKVAAKEAIKAIKALLQKKPSS